MTQSQVTPNMHLVLIHREKEMIASNKSVSRKGLSEGMIAFHTSH